MAERVCPWWVGYLLVSPIRRWFEKPEEVLGPHLESGATALDVGCAMGYFSLPLAELVGPDGRVVVATQFSEYALPTMEGGAVDTPYALNVDRERDIVWICGTNSDTLIRFDPPTEQFRVYPLPTQVTYTRDIDFDNESGVWTSNSNGPTWQIETGVPRVLRLIPGRDPDVSMGVSASR